MTKNQKMKRSIIIGLIVGFILISFIFLKLVLSFIAYNEYTKINHFDNIKVCSLLDDLKVDNKVLIDKYIQDDIYTSSYTYKLCYNNVKFDIYAYEFKNIESAKNYYSRVEGSTVDGDVDYDGNSNLFLSNLTARYKSNVYRIETGNTNDYIEVMRLLNSVFNVNIRD